MTSESRRRAIAWAQAIVANRSVVFADTETTGLGPEAEICDIAIIDIAGRILLNSLVCPLRSIPPEATAVHGITERMVHKAPFWMDLYPRVAAILHPGRVVVIYNRDYDRGILDQVTRADKLPALSPRSWECAMLAYGDFDGTRSVKGPGMKWHKLGNACAALGIETPNAHRARADAEATRQLVLAMADTCPVEYDAEHHGGPSKEGRCPGCGGAWIMGRHFHPREIEDGLSALDYQEDWPGSEPAEPAEQAELFGMAPARGAGRDWTR